jgi:arylsulfatase A-like enzyme
MSPWRVAWLLLVPLTLWLLLSKAADVMAGFAWLGLVLDEFGLIRWLWAFTSLRFLLALLTGYALQRWLVPKHRLAAVPIAAAVLVVLALLVVVIRREQTLFQVLGHWGSNASQEVWMLIACVWSDAMTVAILVLAIGFTLCSVPVRVRPMTVRAVQVLVVMLCGLVGLDYAYELATGQPTNTRVLIFTVLNARDMAALVWSETTWFRVAAIAGGVLFASWWAWRKRSLAYMPLASLNSAYAGLGVALTGASTAFLPAPPVGFLELERKTEGTLIGLVKTMAPSPSHEVHAKVFRDYEMNRQARWHSAGMKLVETDRTRRRNVVVVMIESMRAVSTTLHSPHLPTTPYLHQLAGKGLLVKDMNAVIPRTAAAWTAILAGQYPLTNEGTAVWSAEKNKNQAPNLRALPAALRDVGYATSFFTPTHMRLLQDSQVLGSLGFESVFTETELVPPGTPPVNYFGAADDLVVEPLLDWTAAQKEAGRPFMTAIMTNVGHHAYETPATWRKIKFEGVHSSALQDYYNCLRYIDSVIASLMQGYERLGVLDETIFVFVGDHGQMFGEHGLKQTFNAIYQEGVHVPAIIYAPGLLDRPGTVEGPRQQIDILPTIVELLGYGMEGARLPGVSLLQPVEPDRKLHFGSSIEWTFLALRQGQRKYLYSFDRSPIDVFDLARDPTESRPLKDVSASELAAARQEMLEWKAHVELSMYGRPSETYRPARSWVTR